MCVHTSVRCTPLSSASHRGENAHRTQRSLLWWLETPPEESSALLWLVGPVFRELKKTKKTAPDNPHFPSSKAGSLILVAVAKGVWKAQFEDGNVEVLKSWQLMRIKANVQDSTAIAGQITVGSQKCIEECPSSSPD